MRLSFRWILAGAWAAASGSAVAQEPSSGRAVAQEPACVVAPPEPWAVEIVLSGSVREASLGGGLPGAEVAVEAKDEGEPWRPVTAVMATGEGAFDMCLRLPATVDSIRFVPLSLGAPGEPMILAVADVVALGETGEVRLELEIDLQARGAAATPAAVTLRAGAGNGMSVRGRVTELGSGEPISAATVRLERRGGGTLTGPDGTFVVPVLSRGPDTLRIEHLGYGSAWALVEPSPGITIAVDVQLAPDPFELEPIVVTAVRHRRLEVGGFYERMERGKLLGLGVYFTDEEIRELHTNHVSNIVTRAPSVNALRICAGRCVVLARMAGAVDKWAGDATTGYFRQACPADVYLNGHRLKLFYYGPNGDLIVRDGLDDFVLPAEVIGIEVYRRAGELPAAFGGATDGCGAVVIWTR